MALITSPDVSAHLWPGQVGGAGPSMEGPLNAIADYTKAPYQMKGVTPKREQPLFRVDSRSMRTVALFAVAILSLAATRSAWAASPDYVVTTSSGATIVPGTTDTGNHCDDCI